MKVMAVAGGGTMHCVNPQLCEPTCLMEYLSIMTAPPPLSLLSLHVETLSEILGSATDSSKQPHMLFT